MLYIRIAGGLGNQMFQYAFAKAYSIKHQTSVNLDYTLFSKEKLQNGITPRSYKLSNFPITLQSTNDIPFWASQCNNRITRKLHDLLFSPFIIKDKEIGFDNKIFSTKFSNVTFDGYFQSSKYFDLYRDIILKDFSFPPNNSETFQKIKGKIQDLNSTSLHVRRGDYLNPNVSNILAPLPLEYYQRAINIMKDSTFFVFSDDIKWCEENFKGEKYIFIERHQDLSDIDEIHLMSLCENNIIANSSFSWWGAWLNQNKDKTITVPKKWYVDDSKNANWDIAPKSWHLL